MAQSNAPQAQQTGMARFMPDALARYFRDPAELQPPPQQQQNLQQNQQQQGQQRFQQPPNGQGQQGQGQPGQQQNQPSGATNAGATNDPESFQNPLDVYKNLFNPQPEVDKEGKPIPVNEPPKFALDPKSIGEAASKIDFMSGLPKEVTDKLNSGALDAETLNTLMNHVGRQAYARAMEHNTALTDRFVGMRLNHEQQGLNAVVRRILAQSQVLSNPQIAKNPQVREHMEFVSNAIANKYKDATPEWIAEKTQEYFQQLATAINPSLGQQQQPQEQHNPRNGELRSPDGKVFDWGGYLTETVNRR